MQFNYVSVGGYRSVVHVQEEESGLDAVIALHSTKLGPAVGGVRYYEYKTFNDQMKDALRLAQGMTYKNAAADLPHGGAKTTVNASKIKDRAKAFQELGKAVGFFNGNYICAGDVGSTQDDLREIQKTTKFVAGIDIDTSLPTAIGTFTSIKTLLARNNMSIENTMFTVQGVGKVGAKLIQMLEDAGGITRAYDPNPAAFADLPYTESLKSDEVFMLDTDVFVPCALGGVLNEENLKKMYCRLVCGCANNQFAETKDISLAKTLEYQYVPDFIANCGGVVAVALDFQGKDYKEALTTDLEKRINYILDEAAKNDVAPQNQAEFYAQEKLKE